VRVKYLLRKPMPVALPKEFESLSGLGVMLGGFAYLASYTLRATIPSVTSANPRRPPLRLAVSR